jgi:hypothetical protein
MNYIQELNKFDKKYLIDCILNTLPPRVLKQPVESSLLCWHLMHVHYSENQRIQLQSIIEKELTQRMGLNFTKINDSDIEFVFKKIDYLFCGNSLQTMKPPPVAKCSEPGHTLRKNLGMYTKEDNTIRINSELLLRSFSEGFSQEVCNGVVCSTRIAVLRNVIEHEIVHMIVMNSCYERQSHGKNFMTIAKKIFGHVTYFHQIGIQSNIVNGRILTRSDFYVGEKVRFPTKTGTIDGVVTKINIVNIIVDNKYRVPIQLLSKIN